MSVRPSIQAVLDDRDVTLDEIIGLAEAATAKACQQYGGTPAIGVLSEAHKSLCVARMWAARGDAIIEHVSKPQIITPGKVC